jgi:hypothetical protein
VLAPLAVKVALLPVQMLGLLAVSVTDGSDVTFSATVVLVEQALLPKLTE